MDSDVANASFPVEGLPGIAGAERARSAGEAQLQEFWSNTHPAALPFPSRASAEDAYFDMLSQVPGMWGWKAADHKYIWASMSMARLLGFERPQDINGRADWNLPCSARECAESYHIQDQLVMQKLVALRILDVARFAGGEWRAQITTKFPLLDRRNRVVGVSFYVVDTNSLGGIELSHVLDEGYSRFVQAGTAGRMNIGAGKMTSRESEVLFFLLRGHNAKMIAKVLGISYRTVEHYIHSLKHKFGVSNKYDLHYAAIAQGYLHFLPASLLRKQSSVILGEARPENCKVS